MTDAGDDYPLLVIAGPTASGKSALALHLAEHLGGEVVSCDSIAVYRGMDVGSAKPSAADRARVPHHAFDLYDPDEFCTAGDYARQARRALDSIRQRRRIPVVAGGTGLYLRALLDGLAPAPSRDEDLRIRLRALAARRGPGSLHRLLHRLDPGAAVAVHPNDLPKLIRSVEVTLLARRPQSAQWTAGREPLRGFRTLTFVLDGARPALHQRIDRRAAAMFRPTAEGGGLLEEAAELRARFGDTPRAFGSLGYAQAFAVLREELPLSEAIARAQAGHRQYAKRQMTWFRHQLTGATHLLTGFGDDPGIAAEALRQVRQG